MNEGSVKQHTKRKRPYSEAKISYHNKDIASKIMAEQFKGKSFAVYGIDVPEIVKVLPTNLPEIEANELRLDNLFKFKDGSYGIVDYESKYQEANKNKYTGYVSRVLKKLYNELGYYPQLKLIIIYTANVRPQDTIPVLDAGCIRLELTEAFLIGFDPQEIYDEIARNLKDSKRLSDEELMKLIIYPLTYLKDEDKREAIVRAMELTDQIEDDDSARFVYKCLLVFTDKIIRKKDAKEIRRRLGMLTKVEQIIAKEIDDAVENAVENERLKADKRVTDERRKADRRVDGILTEAAINMFKAGDDIEKISKCLSLPYERLKELRAKVFNGDK